MEREVKILEVREYATLVSKFPRPLTSGDIQTFVPVKGFQSKTELEVMKQRLSRMHL